MMGFSEYKGYHIYEGNHGAFYIYNDKKLITTVNSLEAAHKRIDEFVRRNQSDQSEGLINPKP